MSCNFRRRSFYYIFILAYFLFHLIFLCFLKLYDNETHTNAFKILEIYKELTMKINQKAELDNSGLYKIIIARKLEGFILRDITIISQCSSNHFSSVESLFNAWKGPISVAVFSEVENIEETLWNMAKFIHCNRQRDFSMQLVIPFQEMYIKNFNFVYSLLAERDNSVVCSPLYYLTQNERKNYEWKSPYPINLLRNVAKAQSKTELIFVIDIDMVPNLSLRGDFINFIAINNPSFEKVVYVIPAFEIVPDVAPPEEKSDLLKMVSDLEARPFYVASCEDCQKFTKYDQWLRADANFGLDILYEVDWQHPWEPFFIARRDVPNFDERFKQYGMNRVSQICELHIAGYKFLVIDNGFLVHKGFKMESDFHETKEKEMEMNRRVYSRFKIEVIYKYPNNDRSC